MNIALIEPQPLLRTTKCQRLSITRVQSHLVSFDVYFPERWRGVPDTCNVCRIDKGWGAGILVAEAFPRFDRSEFVVRCKCQGPIGVVLRLPCAQTGSVPRPSPFAFRTQGMMVVDDPIGRLRCEHELILRVVEAMGGEAGDVEWTGRASQVRLEKITGSLRTLPAATTTSRKRSCCFRGQSGIRLANELFSEQEEARDNLGVVRTAMPEAERGGAVRAAIAENLRRYAHLIGLHIDNDNEYGHRMSPLIGLRSRSRLRVRTHTQDACRTPSWPLMTSGPVITDCRYLHLLAGRAMTDTAQISKSTIRRVAPPE